MPGSNRPAGRPTQVDSIGSSSSLACVCMRKCERIAEDRRANDGRAVAVILTGDFDHVPNQSRPHLHIHSGSMEAFIQSFLQGCPQESEAAAASAASAASVRRIDSCMQETHTRTDTTHTLTLPAQPHPIHPAPAPDQGRGPPPHLRGAQRRAAARAAHGALPPPAQARGRGLLPGMVRCTQWAAVDRSIDRSGWILTYIHAIPSPIHAREGSSTRRTRGAW